MYRVRVVARAIIRLCVARMELPFDRMYGSIETQVLHYLLSIVAVHFLVGKLS